MYFLTKSRLTIRKSFGGNAISVVMYGQRHQIIEQMEKVVPNVINIIIHK